MQNAQIGRSAGQMEPDAGKILTRGGKITRPADRIVTHFVQIARDAVAIVREVRQMAWYAVRMVTNAAASDREVVSMPHEAITYCTTLLRILALVARTASAITA